MRIEQKYSPETVIEEIRIIYDTGLGVGSYPTVSVGMEIPTGFALSDEHGYTMVTDVDRERAKRAYPKPSRAEVPPIGEDLDIV